MAIGTAQIVSGYTSQTVQFFSFSVSLSPSFLQPVMLNGQRLIVVGFAAPFFLCKAYGSQ